MFKLKAVCVGLIVTAFACGAYAAGCISPLPKGCTCQVAGGVPVYTPKDCQKTTS